MPAPRKLTDDQIRFARASVAKRREALKLAETLPTMAELAWQLNVTPRYLSEIVNGRARAEQDAIDAMDGST